jgi:hypothetical protein
MTDEEALRRAQNAERLLNDELIKAAIQAVRDQCVEDFKSARSDDVESLRAARASFSAAERFVNALHSHVQGGVIAKFKIDAAKRTQVKRPLQKA